jgi:hypothetical protein
MDAPKMDLKKIFKKSSTNGEILTYSDHKIAYYLIFGFLPHNPLPEADLSLPQFIDLYKRADIDYSRLMFLEMDHKSTRKLTVGHGYIEKGDFDRALSLFVKGATERNTFNNLSDSKRLIYRQFEYIITK